MSRKIRIDEMEAKVRYQADMQASSAGQLRNTSEDVRRAINQSLQAFRELVSDNGDSYFLAAHVGTMTPGTATVDGMEVPWGIIDISSVDPAVVRIMGIDVAISSASVNMELEHIAFEARNYSATIWRSTDVPMSFFSYDQNTIGIVPAPDAPYQYTLWYLPLLPELMADDDEIDPGIPGADEWIVLDVSNKLLIRDNKLQMARAIAQERQIVWQRILSRVSKRQRVSPPKRLDTRGRRMEKRAVARWWNTR